MNNRVLAAISAALISAAMVSIPAEAGCKGSGNCGQQEKKAKAAGKKSAAVRPWGTKQRVRMTFPGKVKGRSFKSFARTSPGGVRRHRDVVAIINNRASSYGVPAWFALRIAHVESGYNPQARGAAGEFGVFQLKCATAKGIGYRGDCNGLLNANTNVEYGLKHLSLAIKRSGGNLQMAASKHNGGLGYRGLVKSYVSKVF